MNQKVRILIIDNDSDAAKLAKLILERNGYEAIIEHSPIQGLAQAENLQPDLVLLDAMMPEMDGWESCRILRANPNTQHIPVIICSGRWGTDEHMSVGFQTGADDYIIKPITPSDFIARVKAVLMRTSIHQPSTKSLLSPVTLESPNTIKPIIFISYRRSDSEDITGRIYDQLTQRLGTNKVFRDVQSMPYGVDFREYLNDMLENCKVLLAVIGKQWLTVSDEQTGRRRIDNADDYVRLEIEAALRRGISVIPVLVQRATMPNVPEFPDTLRDFAYRNAACVRPDPDFHMDMDRLFASLEALI